MARVAVNQDREQEARKEFIYEQKTHRTMRSKNGKLLREEFWTYVVSPKPTGTTKKLASVKGRYWKRGEYHDFEGLPIPEAGLMSITLDEPDSPDSRDGLDSDLFPLTTEQQKNDVFENAGERMIKGRAVYQIHFQPAKATDYGWTGEALIDKEEFQPVSIVTKLSRKLPLAVRTMLGTDVPGLGFSVQYARVDKDIWFPSTYGSEFGVHVLFLLNRTLTESMENTNFRRTNVSSQVEYAPTP